MTTLEIGMYSANCRVDDENVCVTPIYDVQPTKEPAMLKVGPLFPRLPGNMFALVFSRSRDTGPLVLNLSSTVGTGLLTSTEHLNQSERTQMCVATLSCIYKSVTI